MIPSPELNVYFTIDAHPLHPLHLVRRVRDLLDCRSVFILDFLGFYHSLNFFQGLRTLQMGDLVIGDCS